MIESLPELKERTRSICEQELQRAPLAEVGLLLSRNGVTEQIGAEILRRCARTQKPAPDLVKLTKAAALEGGDVSQPGLIERALLIRESVLALGRLNELPVHESVKYLFCEEFISFAQGSTPADRYAYATHASFAMSIFFAMTKTVLLERFPGGQLHWEVSSFRRRWLTRIRAAALPRALSFFAKEARALEPYFVWHIGDMTREVPFLLEREAMKTFYRMAATLEKQPSIRAIMGMSWLHSRETHRVSPHLAFLNRPFIESGGIYLDLGYPKPSSGFLNGYSHRSRLYAAGEYRPTIGAVICSRAQAISWKRAHPEFECVVLP